MLVPRFVFVNLCLDENVTVTAGDEVTGWEATQLQVPHPSIRWKADSLTSLWLQANLGAGDSPRRAYDTVALVGHTGSRHRNLLAHSSLDSTGTVWSHTGWTPSPAFTVAGPVEDALVLDLAVVVSGVGYSEQTIKKPEAVAAQVVLSFFAKQDTVGNLRMYLEGASSSHYARVDFDLSDGTVDSSATAGDFTGLTASSVIDADWPTGWRRYILVVTTDADANLTIRIQGLDSTFDTGLVTADRIYGQVAMLGWDSSTPMDPIINSDLSTAFMVKVETGGASGVPSAAYDSDWLYGVHELDLLDLDYSTFVHRMPTTRTERYVKLTLFDEENVDAEITAGTLIVGKHFAPDWSFTGHGMGQIGGARSQVETRSGTIWREVREGRLLHTFRFEHVERESAKLLLRNYRRVGNKLPVLMYLEDSETGEPDMDEGVIYGFITTEPITHQVWKYWETTLSIEEVRPF